MSMISRPDQPALKQDVGLRSPKAILIAQYSLVVSIGTGTAGLTYFTVSGPDEIVNLVGTLVNLLTVNPPVSNNQNHRG